MTPVTHPSFTPSPDNNIPIDPADIFNFKSEEEVLSELEKIHKSLTQKKTAKLYTSTHVWGGRGYKLKADDKWSIREVFRKMFSCRHESPQHLKHVFEHTFKNHVLLIASKTSDKKNYLVMYQTVANKINELLGKNQQAMHIDSSVHVTHTFQHVTNPQPQSFVIPNIITQNPKNTLNFTEFQDKVNEQLEFLNKQRVDVINFDSSGIQYTATITLHNSKKTLTIKKKSAEQNQDLPSLKITLDTDSFTNHHHFGSQKITHDEMITIKDQLHYAFTDYCNTSQDVKNAQDSMQALQESLNRPAFLPRIQELVNKTNAAVQGDAGDNNVIIPYTLTKNANTLIFTLNNFNSAKLIISLIESRVTITSANCERMGVPNIITKAFLLHLDKISPPIPLENYEKKNWQPTLSDDTLSAIKTLINNQTVSLNNEMSSTVNHDGKPYSLKIERAGEKLTVRIGSHIDNATEEMIFNIENNNMFPAFMNIKDNTVLDSLIRALTSGLSALSPTTTRPLENLKKSISDKTAILWLHLQSKPNSTELLRYVADIITANSGTKNETFIGVGGKQSEFKIEASVLANSYVLTITPSSKEKPKIAVTIPKDLESIIIKDERPDTLTEEDLNAYEQMLLILTKHADALRTSIPPSAIPTEIFSLSSFSSLVPFEAPITDDEEFGPFVGGNFEASPPINSVSTSEQDQVGNPQALNASVINGVEPYSQQKPLTETEVLQEIIGNHLPNLNQMIKATENNKEIELKPSKDNNFTKIYKLYQKDKVLLFMASTGSFIRIGPLGIDSNKSPIVFINRGEDSTNDPDIYSDLNLAFISTIQKLPPELSTTTNMTN